MAGESAGPIGGDAAWWRWNARLDLRLPLVCSLEACLCEAEALPRPCARALVPAFEVGLVVGFARVGCFGLDLGAAAVGALGGGAVSARAAPALSAEIAQTKAAATPRFDERLDLGPNFKP